MWEAIKNALTSVKDATGIEIPGLPADLGAIGDSAATALQTVTESATGVMDGAAPAIDAVTGGAGGLGETVSGLSEGAAGVSESVADSASQTLPDIAGGIIGGSPAK
jgi:hypothetical protein